MVAGGVLADLASVHVRLLLGVRGAASSFVSFLEAFRFCRDASARCSSEMADMAGKRKERRWRFRIQDNEFSHAAA